MMIEEEGLQALRSSLEADGYRLEVRAEDGRVGVRISATPQACADCLVPKPLMRGVLRNALGVPEDRITLIYPEDPEN